MGTINFPGIEKYMHVLHVIGKLMNVIKIL